MDGFIGKRAAKSSFVWGLPVLNKDIQVIEPEKEAAVARPHPLPFSVATVVRHEGQRHQYSTPHSHTTHPST